ncbi:MAG: hypothetical protein M0009_06555 [Deltaproteobacteria bacterium]|nr:hypothetical protein [Deltaproteobacteria bacterium]
MHTSISINQNQKRILVAVITIFTAMLAYPPFQAVHDGTIFNMGYGWITDLFKRGYKTINVSVLLIQWIGTIIVGGIAFVLAKEESFPPTTGMQMAILKDVKKLSIDLAREVDDLFEEAMLDLLKKYEKAQRKKK